MSESPANPHWSIPLPAQLVHLDALVAFAERTASAVGTLLVGKKVPPWGAQQNAAAAIVRLPGLLKAVAALAEGGLAFEADPLVRTLVELAITSLWVGKDDSRAQMVWNDCMAALKEDGRRLGYVGVVFPPAAADAISWMNDLKTEGLARPPNLMEQARAADDLAWVLYLGAYGMLSASTHADPRPAIAIASGGKTVSDALEHIVALGRLAAYCILYAVGEVLGLDPEAVNALHGPLAADTAALQMDIKPPTGRIRPEK